MDLRDYVKIDINYKAGKAARCAGKSVNSNPYYRGNAKYSWFSGWYDEDTTRFLRFLAKRTAERKRNSKSAEAAEEGK